jgi:riboflavin synthase
VFTGIIEEVGGLQELRNGTRGAVVNVAATKCISDLKIGDSIAVNGVCLTATHIGATNFLADISQETLRISSFSQLKQGARVNLERALKVGDRLGGHIMQGHVDGVGRLVSRERSGDGWEVFFGFPRELERYLVYKGSISVNGISLTIASLSGGVFSVAVIPHTFESTNLSQLTSGNLVNLEVDILGKYFERFFQLGIQQNEKGGSRLTSEYLKEQGF